jgi:hypothetical protein
MQCKGENEKKVKVAFHISFYFDSVLFVSIWELVLVYVKAKEMRAS